MSSDFSHLDSTGEEFGTGINAQYDFGFVPVLATFGMNEEIDTVLLDVDKFSRDVKQRLINTVTSIQTEVIQLKEKLRQQRRDFTEPIRQGLAEFGAKSAFQVQSDVAQLLGDVDDFVVHVSNRLGVPVAPGESVSQVPPGSPGAYLTPQARPGSGPDYGARPPGYLPGAIPVPRPPIGTLPSERPGLVPAINPQTPPGGSPASPGQQPGQPPASQPGGTGGATSGVESLPMGWYEDIQEGGQFPADDFSTYCRTLCQGHDVRPVPSECERYFPPLPEEWRVWLVAGCPEEQTPAVTSPPTFTFEPCPEPQGGGATQPPGEGPGTGIYGPMPPGWSVCPDEPALWCDQDGNRYLPGIGDQPPTLYEPLPPGPPPPPGSVPLPPPEQGPPELPPLPPGLEPPPEEPQPPQPPQFPPQPQPQPVPGPVPFPPQLPPQQQPCPEPEPPVPWSPQPPKFESYDDCFSEQQVKFLQDLDIRNTFTELLSGWRPGNDRLATFFQFLDPSRFSPSEFFLGFIDNLTSNLATWLKEFGGVAECDFTNWYRTAETRLILGFIENWISSDISQIKIPVEYHANYLCPNLIPTTDQATGAYLGNTITRDLLECWVRANGNVFEKWWPVVRANRSKLVPNDLIALWRREEITDQDGKDRTREQGYLDDEWEEIKKISEPIPVIQDLIRMMVRDVEDTNIVDRFRLDDQFDEKWTGQLKTWGKYQGLTDEIALRFWRAHWEIPSPRQLYEMLHRLSRLPEGDPRRVTFEDIKTALVQQDIAPFWIDKFLAVSYDVPTRVDIRRSYDLGILSESDVNELYQQIGYTVSDADTLTQFTKRLKIHRGWSIDSSRQYIKGVISKGEWNQQLTKLGYSDSERIEVFERVAFLADIDVRTKCLPAIRHRFIIGELNETEAFQEAMNQVGDSDQAQRNVNRWKCEKQSRGKLVPLRQIRKLFADGVITSAETFQMLINLHYSEKDAGRLVRQMELALEREVTRQEEKALKERMRREKQAEKESEKTAKDAAKALQQTAKARQRLQKTYDSYRKAILKTAERLNDGWEQTLSDTNNELWNLKNDLVREFLESEPFVIAVMETTSKDVIAAVKDDYISQVRLIVSQGEEAFTESLL